MRSRLNSARPPSTVSMSRPCGVDVSAHASPSERKPALRSVMTASVFKRTRVDPARRSSRVTISTPHAEHPDDFAQLGTVGLGHARYFPTAARKAATNLMPPRSGRRRRPRHSRKCLLRLPQTTASSTRLHTPWPAVSAFRISWLWMTGSDVIAQHFRPAGPTTPAPLRRPPATAAVPGLRRLDGTVRRLAFAHTPQHAPAAHLLEQVLTLGRAPQQRAGGIK
jgi:hypothetical protein